MQTAKRGRDVLLMNEDIAADHGIERSLLRNRRPDLALHEKHVGAAVRLGASPRGGEGGGEKGRVANATAHVEHLLAKRDIPAVRQIDSVIPRR
jgi:hypothetical protein